MFSHYPAQITQILDNQRAIINLGGITKEISTALLDEVAEGDYVIIHVGYALTRLDEKEAQKTLRLFAQMLERILRMKYIEEFRNGDFAQSLAQEIAEEAKPNRHYQFMEFCGGHTHAIHRYGIPSLLPKNVEMIHGPGCPVCVLPIARIDKAIALGINCQMLFSVVMADMLRVPGSGQKSLLKAKAAGADVRMIYSVDDALKIASDNPQKEVVFFAIGFETTTPPTAFAIKQAKKLKLK